MASIMNEKNSTVLSGTSSADSIRNAGTSVLIQAYGNDDTIENYGENVTINAGAGNDTVKNADSGIALFNDHYVQMNGKYVSIKAGAGNDYIENYGDAATINAESGNDTIENGRDAVFIYGGSGKDSIVNKYGERNFIDGGADDDYIENKEDAVITIQGGTGNDTLKGTGKEIILFGVGGGFDVVTDYQSKNSVNLTSGQIVSTLLSGNDIILSLGNDSLKLKNAKNKVVVVNNADGSQTIINEKYAGKDISNYDNDQTLTGGLGEDYIYNSGSNVLINSEDGADTIENGDDYVTINAGNGNDSIWSSGYVENVTIQGGTGNDAIENNSSNSLTNGGAGNDYIDIGRYNTGIYDVKNVTVNGGAGNDTIYITYNVENAVVYSGEGDNFIVANDNSEIYLGKGKNEVHVEPHTKLIMGEGTASVFGDNFLVSGTHRDDEIYGCGENMTLNGGAGNDTLSGSNYKEVFQYQNGGGNDVITNYSGEDIVHIASGKIDSYSFDGRDLIFKVGDGSLRLKNMKNHAINVKDSSGKTSTKIYSGGYSPQQVIKNFVKSMANTALDSKSKLDEAIQACSGFKSLQEVINKMVADCRKVGNADKFLRDYCGIITDNEDTGAITGWDAGGLKIKTHDDLMPENSSAIYPSKTTFTKRGLTLTVPEKNSISAQEQLVIQGLYSWWMENSLKLIEKSYGISFSDKPYSIPFKFENKPGDFAWAWGGPLVSVNMAYTNFDESDRTGGGLDGALIHEFTHVMQCNFNVWSYMPNYMTEGMANLTGGSDGYTDLAAKPDTLAQYLDPDNTFSEDRNVYTVGYMFWRYLMKQASDAYDRLGSYAWKNKSSITGTKKADLLTSSGNYMTLSGGAGKDTLTAYGKKSKIYGGSGNDNILTGSTAKNLTISGGTGNDTINNKGTSSKIYSGDGSDKIYNYSDKSTLKGDAGNDFIINGQYWESERGGKKVVIDGGSGVDTITSHGKNSVLEGGSGNDLIYNGYRYYEPWNAFYDPDNKNYNGSNSTIVGGKGNDQISLSSSAANNIIRYASGDGKDTVVGFGKDDTLKITKGTYKTSVSGSDVIVKVGKGSVTLKDAVGKKITVVDSNGKMSTKTYSKNSSSNIAELWFTADDTNFSTSSAQIDSITQNGLSDYALGNVGATTDWTAFTPTDSLTSSLTYADK